MSTMHLLNTSFLDQPSITMWPWSYGSWIYNYLCNQCLSPLMLWLQIPLTVRCTQYTLCDKICQWMATGRWFSLGTLVSSINKTGCHDITNIVESGIKHHNHALFGFPSGGTGHNIWQLWLPPFANNNIFR